MALNHNKKCRTCKYWDTKNGDWHHDYGLKDDQGRCDRIALDLDSDVQGQYELAQVEDGSGYYAKLLSMGDFFCAAFEPKETQ